MVPSYYLITQPFSEERAHETRRRVTPSHVSVFLLGYPPESAPDRQRVSASIGLGEVVIPTRLGVAEDVAFAEAVLYERVRREADEVALRPQRAVDDHHERRAGAATGEHVGRRAVVSQ